MFEYKTTYVNESGKESSNAKERDTMTDDMLWFVSNAWHIKEWTEHLASFNYRSTLHKVHLPIISHSESCTLLIVLSREFGLSVIGYLPVRPQSSEVSREETPDSTEENPGPLSVYRLVAAADRCPSHPEFAVLWEVPMAGALPAQGVNRGGVALRDTTAGVRHPPHPHLCRAVAWPACAHSPLVWRAFFLGRTFQRSCLFLFEAGPYARPCHFRMSRAYEHAPAHWGSVSTPHLYNYLLAHLALIRVRLADFPLPSRCNLMTPL